MVVALLLGLTRPEGNLAALLAFVFLLLKSERPHRMQIVLCLGVFFLLPALIYFTWRYSYYGLWFPLSFYNKVTGKTPGLLNVVNFTMLMLLFIGLCIADGCELC